MTANSRSSVRFSPQAVVARFLCAFLLFEVARFLPAAASNATLQLVHTADYIAANRV